MMLAEMDSNIWIWQRDGEEIVGYYEDPERIRSVDGDYYRLATPSIEAWPGYESCESREVIRRLDCKFLFRL